MCTPDSFVPEELDQAATPESPKSKRLSTWSRVIKRRAPWACLTCRSRKVRCDVSKSWPCSNCRWDSCECIVRKSRGDRKSALSRKRQMNAQSSEGTAQPGTPPEHSSTPEPHRDEKDQEKTADSCFRSPTLTPILELTKPECVDGHPGLELLPFLHPLPSRIEEREIAYLAECKAFTLPEARFQKALLDSFLEFVFPQMPVLDLQNFLPAISDGSGNTGRVSLLLLQAVLLAGSAHVGVKDLLAAGFTSRVEVKKVLFSRFRLLHNFGYETDRFVLIQALLLLSICESKFEAQEGAWHWSGQAVSEAIAMDLHQEQQRDNTSPQSRQLRRQVWWACFIQDRLVALELKRPPRIREGDYDIQVLDEDDFDFTLQPGSYQITCGKGAFLYDKHIVQQIGRVFILTTTLCRQIIYPLVPGYTGPNCYGCTLDSERTLPHETSQSNRGATRAKFVKQRLENWHNTLPKDYYERYLLSRDIKSNTSLAFAWTALALLYYSLVLGNEEDVAGPWHLRNHSERRKGLQISPSHAAASKISDLAGEAYTAGFTCHLPKYATMAVVTAGEIHLRSLTDGRQAAAKLRKCTKLLQALDHTDDEGHGKAGDASLDFMRMDLPDSAINLTPPDIGVEKSPFPFSASISPVALTDGTRSNESLEVESEFCSPLHEGPGQLDCIPQKGQNPLTGDTMQDVLERTGNGSTPEVLDFSLQELNDFFGFGSA